MTSFGPAGIPISCINCKNTQGLIKSISLGLKAYEIEFSRGVRINKEQVNELNKLSINNGINLSCHAPYYINCNNNDKYETTKRNLIDCAKTGLNLKVIVFHTGYLLGMNRSEALKNSINTIKRIIKEANDMKLRMPLGPETAGKKSQIGTISEVITICKEVKECRPVIDWAHLHAITRLNNYYDFMKVIELISDELGRSYLNGLHCHFSGIEFNDKGEVRHQPLNSGYGPDFRLLARIICEKKLDFNIISESPLIEVDALRMKVMLNNICEKINNK